MSDNIEIDIQENTTPENVEIFVDENAAQVAIDAAALAQQTLLQVQEAINGIDTRNTIIVDAGFVKDGQVFTANENSLWNISGNQYTNVTNVVINIPLAATGLQRWERIVFNDLDALERIPGDEVATNPAVPTIPDNKLDYTLYLVTDSEVGQPTPPLVGNQFIKKSFSQPLYYNYPGSNVIIPLAPTGNTKYVFVGSSLVSLNGFSFSLINGNSNAEIPENGKEFIVFNSTTNPITLNHNAVADLPYFFRGGANIVIPPNELILLHFEENTLKDLFRSWNEVSSSNFMSLTDTPSTYVGQSGKVATVNVDENGLEFTNPTGGGSEGYNPNGYIIPDYYNHNWTQVGQHSFNLCSPTNAGNVQARIESSGLGNSYYIIFNFSQPILISEIYYVNGWMGNPTANTSNVRQFKLLGTTSIGAVSGSSFPLTLHNTTDTQMAISTSVSDFFEPFKKVTLANPLTVASLRFEVYTVNGATRANIQKILFK